MDKIIIYVIVLILLAAGIYGTKQIMIVQPVGGGAVNGTDINVLNVNSSELCVNSSCIQDWSGVNASGGGGFSNPATENLHMNGFNITNIDVLKGDGDYIRIGDEHLTSSLVQLNSEDDLLVTNRFEVSSFAYFGDGVIFNSRNFGKTFLSISPIPDSGVNIGVKNENNGAIGLIHIVDQVYDGTNCGDGVTRDNIELRVHSSTSCNTNKSRYVGFLHNKTDGIFNVGVGRAIFKPDTRIEGNLTVKGTIPDSKLYFEQDTLVIEG